MHLLPALSNSADSSPLHHWHVPTSSLSPTPRFLAPFMSTVRHSHPQLATATLSPIPTPTPTATPQHPQLGMHSGCDPLNSEKIGTLTQKMALRMLEKRETEEFGIRAYVSTIPSQSATVLVCALNEFNHSVQRAPQPQPQF